MVNGSDSSKNSHHSSARYHHSNFVGCVNIRPNLMLIRPPDTSALNEGKILNDPGSYLMPGIKADFH